MDWANTIATGIALAALIVSLVSNRFVRVQADASTSAARSAVLSTIFSDVLTHRLRLIRAKLLFGRDVESEITDRPGQVREVFVAYNRAAMMIGDNDALKAIFLKFQRDEIEALFTKCGADLQKILDGEPPKDPPRPNYATAIRDLHKWGVEKGILSR